MIYGNESYPRILYLGSLIPARRRWELLIFIIEEIIKKDKKIDWKISPYHFAKVKLSRVKKKKEVWMEEEKIKTKKIKKKRGRGGKEKTKLKKWADVSELCGISL